MALKSYKAITPSLRQLVIVDRSDLWKGKPVKALTSGKSETGGRNNHGHITAHHRGGGHKRRLRLVDFKRRKFDVPATVGAVSNPDQQNIVIGKAGRTRWLGHRPVVRGVAMNPVDHPHGGGEGKTSGGRHPVTPWGKPTKGKKTRKNKATDKMIIRRRHAR